MALTLSDLLARYTSGALTAMRGFHQLAKKGPFTKAQNITDLATAMADPERIQKNWADLSPAERALVAGLLQRGGLASVRTLRESLLKQRVIDQNPKPETDRYGYPTLGKGNPRAANSRDFDNVLARLTLRGLVFAADDPNPEAPLCDFDRQPLTVVIPDAVRQHLPEPPALPLVAPPPAITPNSIRESSARAFQRDLYLYWSFVREHPVSLTAKDEPHKAALKDVNATLLTRAELGKGEGEVHHPRLRFLRLMLVALDLLVIKANNLLQATDQTDFFGLGPAERVQRCFEVWRDGYFFNEFLTLPREVHPPRLGPSFLNGDDTLVAARRVILTQIKDLAPAGWLAFDPLLEQLRELNYEFLFRRPTPSKYSNYTLHPYTNNLNRWGLDFPTVQNEADGWNKVEANFIRGVVSGPLHWLGLADLSGEAAFARDAATFRLTPLGRWVFGLGPQPVIAAEGGRVIVQPNLHIIALDPVNDATLITLDQFAERLTAERAVEYQLTRASVYAGQQRGWDVPRLQKFLRDQTGADLPGNVARTLDEWQAQHERIIFRPRVTLVHGLPAALDSLAQTAPDLVAARPTPEVVRLTDASAIPRAVTVLGAHNVLPLVTRRPVVPANAVAASATGEVRVLAPRPSLYLHGHLATFADPQGDDHYQISATTIGRATRAGLTAPDILQRLGQVHRGPVPEALARRVRAWAKHYGDAAVEDLTLLQLRDEATLQALLADSELAPLLQPFRPAKTKALARVSAKNLEKLKAALTERGIELKGKVE